MWTIFHGISCVVSVHVNVIMSAVRYVHSGLKMCAWVSMCWMNHWCRCVLTLVYTYTQVWVKSIIYIQSVAPNIYIHTYTRISFQLDTNTKYTWWNTSSLSTSFRVNLNSIRQISVQNKENQFDKFLYKHKTNNIFNR